MKKEKKLLVRWARGDATTHPLDHILENWPTDFKNDPADDLEESLGDWLESAEVGDDFIHSEDQQIFTRTE